MITKKRFYQLKIMPVEIIGKDFKNEGKLFHKTGRKILHSQDKYFPFYCRKKMVRHLHCFNLKFVLK